MRSAHAAKLRRRLLPFGDRLEAPLVIVTGRSVSEILQLGACIELRFRKRASSSSEGGRSRGPLLRVTDRHPGFGLLALGPGKHGLGP